MQAITGEELAQGPYMAARGGVEPTTFCTEGTDNLYLTNYAHVIRCVRVLVRRFQSTCSMKEGLRTEDCTEETAHFSSMTSGRRNDFMTNRSLLGFLLFH